MIARIPEALEEHTYLGRPDQWALLARLLLVADVFGLDTEFYGLDVRKESCVGKARIHVWSVAVRTGKRSPRGFDRARGWVLPAEALAHDDLKDVLSDASITKYVHNQAVDDHALHNHGIPLRGAINTLGYARWKWPHLVTAGGFGLKNLMAVKLGRAPIAAFKDVVGYEEEVFTSKWKQVTRKECACGEAKCRKRREGHEKTAVTEDVETVRSKMVKRDHPLESILPEPLHPRWDLLVRYAAEDAVAALEIAELIDREADPAPFPFGDRRPDFSQPVENEIVLMERVGFLVDVPWCTERAAQAIADEDKELTWLFRWHCVNAAQPGETPEREQVDAVWSSPKQLVEYFDAIGFPRSPIWKKGRVKRDDVKLDATALEWIAKNCSDATQLIKHLLHLKRVRSGKKYLVKLRDSGGHVNPICGPAGDGDDRNGAVTGRLGIKGTLEAQQLPTNEDLDLYQVRRAIVANAVEVKPIEATG